MLRRRPQRSSLAVLASLAALLLLGPVPAGGRQSSDDPRTAMSRAVLAAERALAAGETQIAESRFRTALFEGWMLLGRIEEEGRDLPRARWAYEAASVSVVDVRAARLALADVLTRLGESDEAELVLRTLIAERASDHEARRRLARALGDAGRLDEAVQELEQLRYLTPQDQENAYLLATAYLEQGRVESADELFAEIALAMPTPQTHILIGRTYRDADQNERARAAFETALGLDPDVRRAHYYLGTLLLREQGTAALAEAEREFEQELRVAPDDEMSSLFLGMALVEERRFEEAVPHLEAASRRADVRADAMRFLGRALLETDRVDEGIAALRSGLEAAEASRRTAADVEPTEFEARQLSSLHYQLGQALRQRGERDEADAHFEAAKRYQARSAESARESLDRYLTSEPALDDGSGGTEPAGGRVDPARLAAFRDEVQTSLARVYLNLGVLQVREERHLRATELFGRAAELDPALPGLQYSLGVALFNAERFAQATAPLERALSENDGEGPLREMLGLAWLNAGEPAKAAEVLAEVPGRASNPALQYSYGLALVRSDRAAEAAEVFQLLLRHNAEWPELSVVLGKAFAQDGDYPSAIESLERAIRLDPEVAEAHVTLGEIYLRRGELGEAESELRAELRSHPDDANAAFLLATVLDLAQKQDEAMRVLEALLEERPDLAKGRFLLGKILLARGDAELALEQLEAAAGLAPGDATTRYQLGQAYQQLGRRDDAQREFDTFRELRKEQPAGEDS